MRPRLTVSGDRNGASQIAETQKTEHGGPSGTLDIQAGYEEAQIAELGSWTLWHQLAGCRILDSISANVPVADDELEAKWRQFCQSHALNPQSPEATPRDLLATPPANLRAIVARRIRIAKWKEQTFGPESQKHFARRKPKLDRVVYSLLRAETTGLARELWFRLQEGEATFAELSPRYSVGDAVYTSGLIGPVSLGSLHPSLADALRSAKPGDLLPPIPVAEWFVVARLEHYLPAEFDADTRARMIEELSMRWLEEKIHGTPND